MSLDWTTVVAQMVASQEDQADEGWWPRMDTLIAAQLKAAKVKQDRERAEALAEALGTSPDGETLYFFKSLPTGWDYAAYDANVLVEWATTVVLARQDPGLLGTIH